MPLPILLVLTAVVVLAALAVMRVARVRSRREAQPDGWRMLVLVLGFLIGPPLALQWLAAPRAGPGQLDGLSSIALYVGVVGAFWLLMWLSALLVARFAPVDWRPMLLLALVGRETSTLVPFDPPLTGVLKEEVALVDARNAAFPRGAPFMHQIELPGFRSTWDELDAATRALEGSIAEAGQLRHGVSERALETAADARARLETLRRDAAAHGQAWAA